MISLFRYPPANCHYAQLAPDTSYEVFRHL